MIRGGVGPKSSLNRPNVVERRDVRGYGPDSRGLREGPGGRDPGGMSPFIHRPARPGDRPAVEALLDVSALPVGGLDPALTGFVVAEDGAGRVIGCAGLEEYDGYGLLRSVAVAPAARGAGVGATLTAAVLEEARRRGLRAVYALTTTAERYFTRLGFEVIGRDDIAPPVRQSEEFSSICPSTATALRIGL